MPSRISAPLFGAAFACLFCLPALANDIRLSIDNGAFETEPEISKPPKTSVDISADIFLIPEEGGEPLAQDLPGTDFLWSLTVCKEEGSCTDSSLPPTPQGVRLQLPEQFETVTLTVSDAADSSSVGHLTIKNSTTEAPEGKLRRRSKRGEGLKEPEGEVEERKTGRPRTGEVSTGPGATVNNAPAKAPENPKGPGRGKGNRGNKGNKNRGPSDSVSSNGGDSDSGSGSGSSFVSGGSSSGKEKKAGKKSKSKAFSGGSADDFFPGYFDPFPSGGKSRKGFTGLRGYNRDQVTPVITCSHEKGGDGRLEIRCENPSEKVLRIRGGAKPLTREQQMIAIRKARSAAAQAKALPKKIQPAPVSAKPGKAIAPKIPATKKILPAKKLPRVPNKGTPASFSASAPSVSGSGTIARK